MMTTIRQILAKKPSVYSTSPGATVYDALKVMAEKNVGALVVLQEGELVGIFSERDYARKVVLLERSSKVTPVRDIMSSRVMYVQPQHTSGECMALMTDNRLRHLPVLDGGKLVGLVSIGDLVKDIISEQQFIIEQLEHYISGGGR
jgi:CBS domain-containing protein